MYLRLKNKFEELNRIIFLKAFFIFAFIINTLFVVLYSKQFIYDLSWQRPDTVIGKVTLQNGINLAFIPTDMFINTKVNSNYEHNAVKRHWYLWMTIYQIGILLLVVNYSRHGLTLRGWNSRGVFGNNFSTQKLFPR